MKTQSFGCPQWALLVAVSLLAACDERDTSNSRSLEPKRESTALPSLQKPVSLAAPQQVAFPTTPNGDVNVSVLKGPTLSQQTDQQLGHAFEDSTGHSWNQLLMEMAKRQTPEVIGVMSRHLDEVKGVAVLSGEALYSPELRFPVARALIDCEDKAIADLVSICTSNGASLKKRVLAARVLIQIQSRAVAQAGLEQLETRLSSESDRRLLREAHSLASNPEQTIAMFDVP